MIVLEISVVTSAIVPNWRMIAIWIFIFILISAPCPGYSRYRCSCCLTLFDKRTKIAGEALANKAESQLNTLTKALEFDKGNILMLLACLVTIREAYSCCFFVGEFCKFRLIPMSAVVFK